MCLNRKHAKFDIDATMYYLKLAIVFMTKKQ